MADAATAAPHKRAIGAARPPVRRPFRRIMILGTAALGGFAVGFYAYFELSGDVTPRDWVGTGFGIAAAAAMLVTMLYSLRRSLPSVRAFGRTNRYLQLHLYAGVLFLVLFLLHTDFRLPSGALTIVLWAFSVWVVLTGLLGLALQRLLPTMLATGSSVEVHLQRTDELATEIRERAEAAAAEAGERVQSFYRKEVAPEIESMRSPVSVLIRRHPPHGPRARQYDLLRNTVSGEAAAALDELQQLHAAKLELDVHHALQRLLRIWLWAHLPTAVVLLGLVALHVFFVLYF